MARSEAFEAGKTYFVVYYMDEKLRLPVVETLVYLGPEEADLESGDEPGYLFQFAASFYRDGNWNDLSEEERYGFEEPPIVSFPHGYRDEIVDVHGLIAELEQLRARA